MANDNILDNTSDSRPSKEQNIKQNEINGKAYLFHSLPKEFYGWLISKYILEKKTPIDRSSVTDAQLNGYMWMTVFDATKFSIFLFFITMFSAIEVLMSPNFKEILLSISIYSGFLIYIVWHLEYYAKMKARIAGPVTEHSVKMIADVYISTFFSVFISLIIGVLILLYMSHSLLELFQNMLLYYKGHITHTFYDQKIFKVGIYLYNALIDMLYGHRINKFLSFFTNPYIYIIFLTLYAITIHYIFYKKFYNKEKRNMEEDAKHDLFLEGYPIDIALKKIHDWRKENGL